MIGLDRHSVDFCGDLGNLSGIAATIRAIRPDILVNAAAFTGVDKAESEPELARRINAEAPAVMAAESARIGAILVHYSTDYVFDGSGSRPWREDDAPAPLNTYGRTKWAGEKAILESGCRHIILRTSWVFSKQGTNFLTTMLRIGAERESLSVVDDQIGAPTSAAMIARMTADILPVVAHDPSKDGLYHLTSTGAISWHGFAAALFAKARSLGLPLKITDAAVQPIASKDYKTAAQRPLNSRLDIKKFQNAFGLVLPDWQTEMEKVLREILDTNLSLNGAHEAVSAALRWGREYPES